MNSEKDTLPNNEQILNAINGLYIKIEESKQQLNTRIDGFGQRFDGLEQRFDKIEPRFDRLGLRFDELEQRFDKLEQRFDKFEQRFDELEQRFDGLEQRVDGLRQNIESRFEDMRLQMMSLDVRIDRIEALTHEVLNISYNARADVKVLREEVYTWSKGVRDLQLKIA